MPRHGSHAAHARLEALVAKFRASGAAVARVVVTWDRPTVDPDRRFFWALRKAAARVGGARVVDRGDDVYLVRVPDGAEGSDEG